MVERELAEDRSKGDITLKMIKPLIEDLGPLIHERHRSYRIARKNNFSPARLRPLMKDIVPRHSIGQQISGVSPHMQRVNSKLRFVQMNSPNNGAVQVADPLMTDDFKFTFKETGLTPSDQMRITNKPDQSS